MVRPLKNTYFFSSFILVPNHPNLVEIVVVWGDVLIHDDVLVEVGDRGPLLQHLHRRQSTDGELTTVN